MTVAAMQMADMGFVGFRRLHAANGLLSGAAGNIAMFENGLADVVLAPCAVSPSRGKAYDERDRRKNDKNH